ncbi:MAG: M56 family metallopeptidase [Bryobacteraceae bacterium]|jgi:beta-lactamase regulating signal transducer with metallopeptidase domain
MSWLEWTNIVAAVTVSTALNSIWLGFLLAGLAGFMVRLVPRSNATTRYAIWFTALMLAIVAPALLLIPKPTTVPALASPAVASAPLTVPVTAQWPLYALLAWLAIAAILLARVAWSIVYIHGLKRRATSIGQRGSIRVLASSEARVPMAAGFLRRAIVFPQSVLDELTPQEFEQVLAHESAHLRRWDDWTQLAHAIAEAILFFNPAIYWIGRHLKIEREIACDDWVVSATGEPRPYALCLTHLHEVTRRAPAPQLAPGATSRKRWQISARVEALLQADRNATPRLSRSGWLAAGALAAAALMVAARTAPPVGVQEIPVSGMTLAHLNAPAAPAISFAPKRFVPPRPRLVAGRLRKPELPAPPELAGAPIVLVRAWEMELSPQYFVITVVFFGPPPTTSMNGI